MRDYAVLAFCGAGWGLTQPLTKIALGAGYAPLTLFVWNACITVICLGPIVIRQFRPSARQVAFAAFVGLLGALAPNMGSFYALRVLPSGIVSILIALIPVIALPMALALGLERPAARRLLGLLVGLSGVLILVAPGAEGDAPLHLIPLGLIAPTLYALQNVVIGRWGTQGLSPVQLMAISSGVALAVAVPLSAALGQLEAPRALGRAELGALGAGLIHVVVWTTYVRLVGRAGAVFSTQVGYLVTGFGVLWAMLLLGERYGPATFAAGALILAGVAMVRPRGNPLPTRSVRGREGAA
ncbi:MAG: DMT family transporter [Hasllibacter sp.]